MSTEPLFRFKIDRIPSSVQAKNTVGYKATPFRVIAANEGEAIGKAQDMSTYDSRHFAWRVRDCEELTPAEMGTTP